MDLMGNITVSISMTDDTRVTGRSRGALHTLSIGHEAVIIIHNENELAELLGAIDQLAKNMV